MIFNILDNTTELWITTYIIDEFFSSSGATLYKNPTDQTVGHSVIGNGQGGLLAQNNISEFYLK